MKRLRVKCTTFRSSFSKLCTDLWGALSAQAPSTASCTTITLDLTCSRSPLGPASVGGPSDRPESRAYSEGGGCFGLQEPRRGSRMLDLLTR